MEICNCRYDRKRISPWNKNVRYRSSRNGTLLWRVKVRSIRVGMWMVMVIGGSRLVWRISSEGINRSRLTRCWKCSTWRFELVNLVVISFNLMLWKVIFVLFLFSLCCWSSDRMWGRYLFERYDKTGRY